MKKIIVFCVAFLATMSLWASETSVENAYGVEIWYDFDSSTMTASVTYKGYSLDYSDDYAYTGEVVIPSTVTYAGEEYNVTSIGEYAFSDCHSLTSITIPEGVTSIGDDAFARCSSLTSITIPEGVTAIGDDAFYLCSSLTSIDVAPNNENYTSIDGVLFSKDKTILIKYPEGKDATSYTIPEGVTWIGDYAFYDCDYLTSITLPEGVTEIGDFAFKYCSSLTSITLPSSLTTIGSAAFRGCIDLISITLPSSLTTIRNVAFDGCSSLTSITLPGSVTTIGYAAFEYCSSLTSIDVALNNENYASIDGVLFSKDKTILIQYPEGKDATSYMIPESVKSIEENAFYRSSLTSITIPESVTWIGDYAFYDCDFTSITCKNTTPPESSYLTFYDVDKSIPLYVPAESVEAYKNAVGWKEFTNIQAIPFSSVANTKAETQDSVRKEYRDGQVLIIKGDKTYTMFGTEY